MGINESRPSRGRDETAFDEGVQTLEGAGAENPDIGRRDSDQAAKSGALSKLRVRSERAACALSWLAVPRSGIGWLVSEARQSAASSSSRAPPKNEDEKTGGTNRAASAASTVATGDGQPASARRSGGPTADRAHADGGSAGTRLPRRSNAKAGPACRASIGAAQRRPCSEPRPAARSRSTARRRAVRGGEERQRRAGGSKNRDASGGAVLAVVRAARQRREVSRYQLPRHGRPIAGSTFVRRPRRTTI